MSPNHAMVPSANPCSQRAGLSLFAGPSLRSAFEGGRAARCRSWPSGENRGGEAAARGEFAADDAPFRLDGVHDVAQHLVESVFVEDAEGAVSQQIHFQRFE